MSCIKSHVVWGQLFRTKFIFLKFRILGAVYMIPDRTNEKQNLVPCCFRTNSYLNKPQLSREPAKWQQKAKEKPTRLCVRWPGRELVSFHSRPQSPGNRGLWGTRMVSFWNKLRSPFIWFRVGSWIESFRNENPMRIRHRMTWLLFRIQANNVLLNAELQKGE